MLNKMIGTFIRRPVFTTMFVLLLVVFGIKSYPNLGVDLYPDVELASGKCYCYLYRRFT